MAVPEFEAPRRSIVGRSSATAFTVIAENQAVLGAADMDGILQQRLQNTLKVERRAADGLEHVGGCRLLLQRFPQLGEQPHVLDRNYSLSSQGGEQFNLLFRKGSHNLAVNTEY